MAKTIAISRQRGTGGAYIGQLVAERLGLRYIDRELLRHAAEYLKGHNAHEPAPAAVPSWLDRLAQSFALGAPGVPYIPPASDDMYEGELFEIERRLMLEIAEGHEAVIAGRGAAQTFRGKPGVLTVFLHAPESWRAERLRQIYQLADSRAAQQMVRDSDRERARFIEALRAGNWTDVRGYDLALDTATVGFDTAVDVIVRAAAHVQPQ